MNVKEMGLIINNNEDPPFLLHVWKNMDLTDPFLFKDKACTQVYGPNELITWNYFVDWRNTEHFGPYDYVLGRFIG